MEAIRLARRRFLGRAGSMIVSGCGSHVYASGDVMHKAETRWDGGDGAARGWLQAAIQRETWCRRDAPDAKGGGVEIRPPALRHAVGCTPTVSLSLARDGDATAVVMAANTIRQAS